MATWVSLIIISAIFFISSVDSSMLEPKRRCIPTSIAKGPCHSCICGEDGVFHCRLETCNKSLMAYASVDGQYCQPDFLYVSDTKLYNNNDLLYCSCSNSGYWLSSNCKNTFHYVHSYLVNLSTAEKKIKRAHFVKTQFPILCSPNELYILDCNVCLCNNKGEIQPSSCTNRTCRSGNKSDNCIFGQWVRTKTELCACSDVNFYIDRLCMNITDAPVQRVNRKDLAAIIPTGKFMKTKTRRSQKLECVPDTYYQMDCNKCFCDKNGVLFCTNKLCLEQIPLEESAEKKASLKTGGKPNSVKIRFKKYKKSNEITDRDSLPSIREGDNCTEGKTYRMDCNTCQCTKDNSLLCTKMACLNNEDVKKYIEVINKPMLRDKDYLPELPAQNCVPGKMYQNGCMKCFCTVSKKAVCSNVTCSREIKRILSPRDVSPELTDEQFADLPSLPNQATKCKPGKTYRVLCNTCLCLANGNLFCEDKMCLSLEDVNRVRANKESGKPCKEADIIDSECIKCLCAKNLQKCEPIPSCTPSSVRRHIHGEFEKIKPRLELKFGNDKCLPGMIYKTNCNNCYCQAGSKLVCTKKGCLNYQQVKMLLKQKAKLMKQGH